MPHTPIRAVALLALASLASCSSSAAGRIDPLGARPEDIVVAIGVPETFHLQTGNARLHVVFAPGEETPSRRLDETFALRIAPNALGGPESGDGQTVHLVRIAGEDAHRFEAIQADIRALRAGGAAGTGSVSVQVTGGCFSGAVPNAFPVSTWLQTNPVTGYVALTHAEDVFSAVGPGTATSLRRNFSRC